jgi:transposase
MTKVRKPYKTYPKEFKLEALRLMEESGRSISETAMELGLRRNQLYKWKEQMTKKVMLRLPRKAGQSYKINQKLLVSSRS